MSAGQLGQLACRPLFSNTVVAVGGFIAAVLDAPGCAADTADIVASELEECVIGSPFRGPAGLGGLIALRGPPRATRRPGAARCRSLPK